MPLILGANSAAGDTGYSIDKSCRFNDLGYLIRTPSSSGDPKTFTISCWIKRGNLGAVTADQTICTSEKGSGYRYTYPFYLNGADDKLYAYGGTFAGGSPVTLDKKTAAVYRDPAAWFHYYCAFDTTESVAADRVKLYINGSQITDAGVGGGFSPNTIPALNSDTFFGNTTDPMSVCGGSGGGSPFDGYMAEFIFVDGTVPAVTEFGEFDEDSPTIWRPKDPSEATITWGTNGLWLDFKDSADLGNDVSGQGNDMPANSLTASDQATDSPTNNFCTMNNLDNVYQEVNFSEGNNSIAKPASPDNTSPSTATIGLTAGKWYWELKCSVGATASWLIGIMSTQVTAVGNYELGKYANDYAYSAVDGDIRTNSAETSYGNTYAAGDIIGVALDLDNNKLYFRQNGSAWEDSGDPTSGATGTGAVSITDPASTTLGCYFPAHSFWSGTGTATTDYNFGGCSAFDVTSANQDGNGYGNFEYAVPSGYLAICTKNLGSSGG